MKDELDALDVAISKPEAHAHLARHEARQRYHDEVDRLREHTQAALAKWVDLKVARRR
jgi:hypothetical protein